MQAPYAAYIFISGPSPQTRAKPRDIGFHPETLLMSTRTGLRYGSRYLIQMVSTSCSILFTYIHAVYYIHSAYIHMLFTMYIR